jgi:alcohol dehydrogenase (cytochrome c)
VHSLGDKVQALDAATGDLLWQYSRRLSQGSNPSNKRVISLYGDKLYTATSDSHIFALDARTGNVVWDQALAGVGGITGGPLVAKDKVMIGTNSRTPGGGEIIRLDAETGKIAWRFHSIAQPGEPNGDSWNGLPLEKRNGGSVWVPGRCDPTLGLAFFGIAQTYDTGPLRILVKQTGITNDALYTDCTVALVRTPARSSGIISTCPTINGIWIGCSNAS